MSHFHVRHTEPFNKNLEMRDYSDANMIVHKLLILVLGIDQKLLNRSQECCLSFLKEGPYMLYDITLFKNQTMVLD